MKIMINKFGYVLTSRQSGKEAYAAFLPTLASVGAKEEVHVDFAGVHTFSPSWGDEFLTPLLERFADRLELEHVAVNPSVALTVELLEKTCGRKFHVVK